MGNPDFNGLAVLVLESRRSRELSSLVSTYGGRPVAAPAMREVPLDDNPEALAAAEALLRGEFDVVILLTGVGTRAWLDVAGRAHPRDRLVEALAQTKVVARGPKPLAVLRELTIAPWVVAPEPNTWKELLAAMDATGEPLHGRRVAVQEYGVSNRDLLEGLRARGAEVTPVPVYQWALPDDVQPLRGAIASLTRGELGVAIITTGVQAVHLFQVAADMGLEEDTRAALRRMVVASIGPTTSETLRQYGLEPDLEASHPKMGFLVREAAERGPVLLRSKR